MSLKMLAQPNYQENILMASNFKTNLLETESKSILMLGDKTKEAGIELILYTKHHYLGMGIFGVGYTFVMVGYMNAINSSYYGNSSSGNGMVLLGGILSIAGAVLMIESHIHIAKAGKLLILAKQDSKNVLMAVLGNYFLVPFNGLELE